LFIQQDDRDTREEGMEDDEKIIEQLYQELKGYFLKDSLFFILKLRELVNNT
jgi:hypothetical protein